MTAYTKLCFFLILIIVVNGDESHQSHSAEDKSIESRYLPLVLQKLLESKIDFAKEKDGAHTYGNNLGILIKDKKVQLSNPLKVNLKTRDGTNYSYLVQVKSNKSHGDKSWISSRAIIVAPILCRRGYKMDSIGICRQLL